MILTEKGRRESYHAEEVSPPKQNKTGYGYFQNILERWHNELSIFN